MWETDLVDKLHKPVKRKFPRRHVISKSIDKIWAVDLVEMQQFSKWNNGYKYLLMIIDIFFKFGWIVPLKNKKGKIVAKAFNQIFKENRVPKYLWTDNEKNFITKI